MCKSANTGTDAERLETTPPDIRNNPSKNGEYIRQERKALRDRSGNLGTETEGSCSEVFSGRTFGDRAGAGTSRRKRSSDEVVEELHTAVRGQGSSYK